ncbi:HPF/RaiA family ribosome-associated protein [Sphingosinicella soli]|uniref:Ribosome-associated translation inhibitor RaiA n=1 Tax=Sphingosinicella soli TaxID=333708 RepID=A0A7W7F5H4_9SPHN|nr:HPF/RaiA family ribosome-associated protein [Sphingosinicella soli]MBB4630694.1 ribosome-associated translation inhibitor RaiA [Sphingosinicella soli]
MKIAIQTRDAELTDDLREHLEQRLAFALSRCQNRIRGVVVGLSDINGSKGGIDKRCHLRIRLNGLSDIAVEETEADFDVAANHAADRAKRTLARRPRYARDIP